MRIQIIVDETVQFSWYSHLLTRLRERGHVVAATLVAGAPEWPAAVHILLDLEQLVARRRGAQEPLLARLRDDVLNTRPDSVPDVVFDLSGRPVADHEGAIRILYDGLPDPAAAIAALLDGRPPRLDLAADGHILATAWPASEEPGSLTAGLRAVFARALDLCLREVARRAGAAAMPSPLWGRWPERPDGDQPSGGGGPDGGGPGGTEAFYAGPPPPPAPPRKGEGRASSLAAARFGLQSLAAKARGRLTRLLTQPEAWRVGYRRLDGPGILDTCTVPEAGWSWLPEDGRRFLADPFLIAHQGRTWLCCEEFPYATRKGIISVCEIGPDGRAGPLRPVLETGSHLSYPYVFEERGEIWMIPESSAAGDVVLYRATDFPFRWQPERKLLDGLAAADATPVLHEGRLWLFASLMGAPGGSSWDALGLFHAPDLFGAFEPHPLNPVLIDAGSARPAGRMYRRDGRLMRLAQDCRAGYGAATTVAVVDRLDPEGYAQTVTHRIAPPPAWQAAGLHTIDVGGGYQAIDIFSQRAPS